MAGGRPTKYNAAYAPQAEVACREGGFTILKLSKLFSVTQSSIKLWMKNHSEFSAAIKKGRDDFNVMTAENCLLKRVKGYRYTETTKEPVMDAATKKTTLQTTKIVTKSVAPDVTAQIFFLKNRDPQRWRDKIETVITAPGIEQILNGLKSTPLVKDASED